MNQWYKKLKVAPWNPPDYVFGIVWPILYVLMFTSATIVYLDKKCYPYCYPLTIFFAQLILNLSGKFLTPFQLQPNIYSKNTAF